MLKVISCGAAIINNNKLLLCHATDGNRSPKMNDKRWGVPKGTYDDDTDYLETAIRETFEESHVFLKKKHFWNKGSVYWENTYNSAIDGKKIIKNLKVFLYEGDISKQKPFRCLTKIPNSNILEVDQYYWAEHDKAIKMVARSQMDLVEKLHKDGFIS